MHLGQLYKETVQKFLQAGIDEARSNAEQLLCFCLGMTRSQLFLHAEKEISPSRLIHCRSLIDRRLAREPLHYIVGAREFWSLDFFVTTDVLIPRPETEFLIEVVLAAIQESGYHGGTIVDMCTGSGVIAVVLALELKVSKVIAVDASPGAVRVAAANIARYGMSEDVSLVCSDLFTSFIPEAGFEIVVANPPYIADDDIACLQPEVRNWEPKKALAGGKLGLDMIEKIAIQAHSQLVPGGWIFMEIGADQKDPVRQIFAEYANGAYSQVEIIEDWSQRPRVLKARKKDDY